jgi:4-alpha-glucanotransferase
MRRDKALISMKSWIEPGYVDASGAWQKTSHRTTSDVLAALGAPIALDTAKATCFARPGDLLPDDVADLVLEDGSRVPAKRRLPRDMPLGYHALERRDGTRSPLVVSPGTCFLPDDLDAWGFAIQLYALQSKRSAGMGDLSDLARFGRLSRRLGASVLLLNPIDAVAPNLPQPTSPYSPVSRIYKNVSYLDVTSIPGFRGLLLEKPRPERHENTHEFVLRDDVFRSKFAVLARLFALFAGSRAFDAFLVREGACLDRFATFSALAERHGADFRAWPAEYRDCESTGVQRFRRRHAERVRFHAWLQWHLERQLHRAERDIGLIFDLPVGVDPGGADAWMYPGAFATQLSVGAPPDGFSPAGQDWGICGFSPHGLERYAYEPFIRMVRSAMRHACGLRVDHVMGLFRLFMIPQGNAATAGAYVRYDHHAVLDVLALESHRARAFVVGEDLGTVDPAHRVELARRRVLSYRVAYFESKAPARYPRNTLASVTTHDLPTIAGVVTGSDMAERRHLGVPIDEAGEAGLVHRVERLAGLDKTAPIDAIVEGVHRSLSRARSRVRIVSLDDAIASPLRPNIPGIAGAPSFCRKLPLPLEAVARHPLLKHVAEIMNEPGGARVKSRRPGKRGRSPSSG